MKKKITAFALCFMLACSGAFAEESGLFLGLGFGAHGAKQEIKTLKALEASGIKLKEIENTTDFGGAFVFGYKHIFDEHSGLRVYLSAESNNVEVETTSGKKVVRSYDIMVYNVDYLFDFTPNFGAFVGLGVGAISWDKEFWSIDWENDDDEFRGYVAAQLGLRAILGEKKRHAIELFGKLPFTKTTIEYQMNGVKIVEMNLKQTYNVGLRYIYTFPMD